MQRVWTTAAEIGLADREVPPPEFVFIEQAIATLERVLLESDFALDPDGQGERRRRGLRVHRREALARHHRTGEAPHRGNDHRQETTNAGDGRLHRRASARQNGKYTWSQKCTPVSF